ncbi:MAG: hypothetical protein MJA83_17205 [Gammaproteobacteria bacterium]|nr:hypothetical protein [Gammaproteobacteria bacterium]
MPTRTALRLFISIVLTLFAAACAHTPDHNDSEEAQAARFELGDAAIMQRTESVLSTAVMNIQTLYCLRQCDNEERICIDGREKAVIVGALNSIKASLGLGSVRAPRDDGIELPSCEEPDCGSPEPVGSLFRQSCEEKAEQCREDCLQ